MKKLTIKKIIEFRSKGAKAKRNFALALKQNKPEPKNENGGDYWKISVSAIAKACKQKKLQIIEDKINQTEEKLQKTKHPPTKIQYSRNIEIMLRYKNFDFGKWMPPGRYELLKNHKAILTIKELAIEASPQIVFRFGKDNLKDVGAIWIVARKGGFEKIETGMFTDMLGRYLRSQYGKKYTPNPRYCLTVDIVSKYEIDCLQLQSGDISYLLNKTLDELKHLM